MKAVILNGKKARISILTSMAEGLSDPEILTEKGGYLFRSATEKDCLHLGIIPCLFQGERNYHYNIHLPEELEYHLTGSVNTRGIFSILFKSKVRQLTREMKTAYRKNYRDLAGTLLECGYRGSGELDPVTSMLLKDSGLFENPPGTLTEILDKT